MNQVRKNWTTIPTRIALAAIGTFFVAACKNAGFTLNVIVLLLIYIALSMGLDGPTIYSEMDKEGLAVS